MKRFKIFSKKTIIAGSVIFVSFLFVLMAFAPALSGAGQEIQPATAEKSYIPNPTLNTNISWNTFYSTWSPEEYNNGTANTSLNAGYSTFYKNPISVSPVDIEAYGLLQNDKIGGQYWNNTTIWTVTAGVVKGTAGLGKATQITMSYTTANSNATYNHMCITIPVADYPSANLAYDYVTGIIGLNGPTVTGTTTNVFGVNSTGGKGIIPNVCITPGQQIYFSMPITSIKGVGFNTTTGAGYSSSIKIQININTPSGAPTGDTWTATLGGLAFTDYAIPLGTNSTGAAVVNEINPTLKTFGSTALTYNEVLNSGYSVAVSQTMQNITESQTSISDGSYIEQATYQGTLSLPTAPGLTYNTANISLGMTLPGSQYEVATLNGASYLSGVEAKDNGTYYFGTVNPNSPNSMILEAKYTASQWDASTHAPSFFTLRGLEYYWWVGVIAGLSVIGLGAAALSHFGGAEEDLKIPKGKFGR